MVAIKYPFEENCEIWSNVILLFGEFFFSKWVEALSKIFSLNYCNKNLHRQYSLQTTYIEYSVCCYFEVRNNIWKLKSCLAKNINQSCFWIFINNLKWII